MRVDFSKDDYASRWIDAWDRNPEVVKAWERCGLPILCEWYETNGPAAYSWIDHVSQYGQDIRIMELTARKRNGVFLDIGANEGFGGSNTYVLEKCLGWTGICFEPNPKNYERLVRANRVCQLETKAVSATDGETVEFVDAGTLGGIHRDFSKVHEARVVRELGGITSFNVTTVSLRTVLQGRPDIQRVDFASVDVEGAELSVLQGLELGGEGSVPIRFLAVENDYGDEEVPAFLRSKGYAHIGRAGGDDLYQLDERLWNA